MSDVTLTDVASRDECDDVIQSVTSVEDVSTLNGSEVARTGAKKSVMTVPIAVSFLNK